MCLCCDVHTYIVVQEHDIYVGPVYNQDGNHSYRQDKASMHKRGLGWQCAHTCYITHSRTSGYSTH